MPRYEYFFIAAAPKQWPEEALLSALRTAHEREQTTTTLIKRPQLTLKL